CGHRGPSGGRDHGRNRSAAARPRPRCGRGSARGRLARGVHRTGSARAGGGGRARGAAHGHGCRHGAASSVTVLAAIDRATVADFLAALVTVYSLMIFAYVLVSLIFSFGVRV